MKKLILASMVIISFIFLVTPLHADDASLFITTQVSPEALIILDMSSSMNQCPDGTSRCCTNYPDANNPNCIGLRKLDIARQVIFDFLDDVSNGILNNADEDSLNFRVGYMRFYEAGGVADGKNPDDDGDPFNGFIKILAPLNKIDNYQYVWQQAQEGEFFSGITYRTPLAATLSEAKTYFVNTVNPNDTLLACRTKYVIFITDGGDTLACGGYPTPYWTTDFRMRMKTILKSKQLYDAGVKVLWVGFAGDMPEWQKRTLNWAARFSGTDNPLIYPKTGNPEAYDLVSYLPGSGDPCDIPIDGECAHVGDPLGFLDPTPASCTKDPKNYELTGYAFFASDASQLSTTMKKIFNYIRESSYTFSSTTVPSVRMVGRDVLYMPSMTPKSLEPWVGNIKAYQLNEDGTLPVDQQGNPSIVALVWDAAQEMNNTSPGNRKIYTSLNDNSDLTAFTYDNISNSDLGLSGGSVSQLNTTRDKLIKHIRGVDVYDFDKDGNTTEDRVSKLGDFFHSNAVIVGAPSPFFMDNGYSGADGFYDLKKNRAKVIIAGANDGMLHAFYASNGTEAWAFIPPSLLKSLKSMIPVGNVIPHVYYVDSTPKVGDVWWDLNDDNTKQANEWKTVLLCGLRGGGKQYFALNITDLENPKFMWEFPKSNDSTRLNLVGYSWSEPAIGRVKISSGGTAVEKWVAFIGGGQEVSKNTGGRCFFVVDIRTGDVVWEFCYDKNASNEKAYMNHPIPAPPTAVDTNMDGYIDKVYIGDRGAQMWVFGVSDTDTTKWTGKRLFRAPADNPEKHSIYSQPAVAFDNYGIPWVFFGTGDREDLKAKTHYETFYAVVDDGKGNYPRTLGDLTNRSGDEKNTYAQAYNPIDQQTKRGWYITFDTKGEKVLAKPSVFNRLVYFTTYKPEDIQGNLETCSEGGVGKLYIVEYLSGGGALEFSEASYALGHTSARSKVTGIGTLSTPVITVDLKGQAVVISGTLTGQVYSATAFSPGTSKQTSYWREVTR